MPNELWLRHLVKNSASLYKKTLLIIGPSRYVIKVRHYEVLSINRIHEVFGHFSIDYINNIDPGYNSQRDIPVFPLGPMSPLVFEKLEASNQPVPRVARSYDVVDESPLGCHKGVGIHLTVFFRFPGQHLLRIFCLFDLLAVNDLCRAFGAKHGDFGCRPGKIDITADVLGIHDIVSAAVSLPDDDRYPGHCCF